MAFEDRVNRRFELLESEAQQQRAEAQQQRATISNLKTTILTSRLRSRFT